MTKVTFTLRDNTTNPPKNISMVMEYTHNGEEPDMLFTIQIGDELCTSIASVPFDMLSAACAQMMDAHQKQKSAGLVGFDKQPIIGIN